MKLTRKDFCIYKNDIYILFRHLGYSLTIKYIYKP